jgi:hypothetical protein
MAEALGFKVIDMKAIAAKVKGTLGTEEEPFEGEVPIKEVEKAIATLINQNKATSQRVKYVFDGFTHKDVASFIQFAQGFGAPEFVLNLTVNDKLYKDRFCKKNEVDDIPEDQLEEHKALKEADEALRAQLAESYKAHAGRVNLMTVSTDASLETTSNELRNKFSPKVILVNHEKRLGIDTTCANLAIKYNMIYISAYQIIKAHIEGKTDFGHKLLATRRNK